MPMPKPKKDEQQKDFISRFMGDETMLKDYPDQKQRLAIAYSQWENKDSHNAFDSFAQNMSMLIKKINMAGREHYVAPVVLMPTECVMNGKFYTKEATQASVESWNGRAVLVYHPDQPVTANTPETNAAQGVGTLYNTRIENGFLKADAYIDVEKAKAIPLGRKLLEKIENNVNMDVSTGMKTHCHQENNQYNGKTYTQVVDSFDPDHLAILPDKEGASSWRDGAGFARNENDHNNNVGETKMKKELIDQMVANGIITEAQKPEFEKAPDAVGEFMIAQNTALVAAKKETEIQVANAKKEVKQTELNPEDRALLDWAKNQQQEQKDAAIAAITANAANIYSKEELAAMPLDALKKLQSFAAAIAPKTNYSVNGVPFVSPKMETNQEVDDFYTNKTE
jgi:hypothetical protein